LRLRINIFKWFLVYCSLVKSRILLHFCFQALPDPSETNNTGISGLFAGAQNYSVK